jgi:hypothetical protein
VKLSLDSSVLEVLKRKKNYRAKVSNVSHAT